MYLEQCTDLAIAREGEPLNTWPKLTLIPCPLNSICTMNNVVLPRLMLVTVDVDHYLTG